MLFRASMVLEPFLTGALALVSFVPAVLTAKEGAVAIYAVIDQVTVESDGSSPALVRIFGTFLVPRPIPHLGAGDYLEPQQGYLLLRVIPGTQSGVEKEVAELKSVAGTRVVVGFGDYWKVDPARGEPFHVPIEVHVRKQGETAAPEPYPYPRGVVKATDSDPRLARFAARLRSFLN